MEISISGRGLLCTVLKPLPLQLRRVMKLTALLLTVICIHVSARSYEQNVSFSGKNVPLEAIFASIEKQTGFSFFFNYDLLKDAKPVTVNVKDVSLEILLNTVLWDQGLDYYRAGKTVFVIRKNIASASTQDQSSSETGNIKQLDIKGKVISDQGEPLTGATVTMMHGRKATVTDEKGLFELKGVPVGSVLIVTYLGYQSKEVNINKEGALTIQMAVATNKLDDVEVIAYGNTTERLSTGNITTVRSIDIEKQPVDNPLLALEGRVPGLFITQSTGYAGSGIVIKIQGQNSIANGNDPFYVIDGVPYTSELLPNLGGGILGYSGTNNTIQAGNPLSFINPGDIESISVLKDADATAIYGSRAANGAILITTKKGKVGQTRVNLNVQNGWGNVTRKLNVLNNAEYLEMRHEAEANDGLTVSPTDYDINGLWDTTRSTDWQKKLIGGTSQYTNAQGTISGGNSATQFLVSGGFHRQTTVLPGDFADQKGSLHFNLKNVSENQRFKLSLTGNYLIDVNKIISADLTNTAVTLPPDAPPLHNADGTLNWMPDAAGVSSWGNPLAQLNNSYTNKTTNLIGNGLLSYQLFPGLEIGASLGYTNLQSNEITTGPLSAIAPENRPYNQRVAQYANNNINSWIIEPQATYKTTIADGKAEFLIGETIEQNNSNGQQFTGVGYNSDAVLGSIESAANIYPGLGTVSTYKYNALFGRVNYSWEDTYLIDLTARRDGSSRFGSANQFHDFEAAGIGWIFSKEAFIKDHLSFLSFGKLRASYGTSGNDQVGDYQYLNLYFPVPAGVPYQGVTGLVPIGLPNPYLQWELTRKLQAGIGLGVLKDRILINLNYYRNRSSNQLLPYALPIISGFTSVTDNFPATVQNEGWEITLNTTNIKSRRFTWSTSINLTLPKNKLIAFPNLATSSYANSKVVGEPVNIVKTFNFAGVDSVGEYVFKDVHGNVTPTPDAIADRTGIVKMDPTYYGGVENSFSYKGFQLDVSFQFVKQLGSNDLFGVFIPGQIETNQPAYVLKRWRRPGDITNIERYNSTGSLATQYFAAILSNEAFSDASYIRLKNLAFSWQLPETWRKKAHLTVCRIYAQGQNLLTFTKYKGMDPENQTAVALPPLRVLTLGIQVGL